jgi:hypothetical protein
MSETSLPGVNVLIMGPTGVGKTHSIGTLVDTGITVVCLFFENGQESLRGYYTDKGKPIPKNLKICTIKNPQAGWTQLADSVRQVNTMSYELLKKTVDSSRSKYDQFEQFLRNFTDVVTDDGEHLGPVDSWGPDKALVIDGLTGMGVAAKAAVVGGKFDMDQKDWGLSQNMMEGTLRRLCDGCRCHFVLLAHVEREPDPLGGASKITVSAPGAKLAPKIPAMFSDVILASRLGRDFVWDTENPLADLKTRNLPIASKNLPTFASIIEKWKSRGGVIAS